MMDCDTTGIEPDLALTKAKKLVGGGTMLIVNQTIPRALRQLGYSSDEADAIVDHSPDPVALPYDEDAFDAVLSCGVLEHVSEPEASVREIRRVLRPGGRFAVTDIVADPEMDEATRRDMAQWTGCIAGALTEEDFRRDLAAAGFERIEITETHRVHEHAGSAIVRAVKP
jgi:SAM-dependent methyltransferase